MKRFWIVSVLILLLTGCGQNNREKAIEHLTQNQRNDASLIVFTDRPAERPFIVDLQTELNEVNNQNLRAEGPITNVTFYNIRDEHKFKFEKIFELETYPYMILFEKGQITLETHKPEEIVQHFE
ncbi:MULTISPECIES: hypothetical protein [unclassified Paenibacillus]|uniref:hypothetical protein n=1 Tax=unclassified Paenibacillus TaxID=185978 RepID=UPI0008D804E4|nr:MULTISPECIES: hypothetical protein [unclassified Paenibacillus]QLG36742.1 hypothetical protein HW560_00355 [Paenibacillus sp. E222]SEM73859.1 hypothetical protein SAMN05518670_0087 [Paenibacillus sp. OK076]